MKGVAPLFAGIFGTFAFSWAGLVAIPNAQIGHLDPQMDEEGTDVYPAPQSGMVERGRRIYAANGCVYCHTQQVRAEYAGADIERGWGTRRSAPRDYVFERPAMLGRMRMGPDLSNVGKRQPADDETAPPPGATAPAAGAQPAGATPPAPAAGAAPAPGGAAPAAAPAPGAAPAPAAGAPAAQPPTGAAPAAPAPAGGTTAPGSASAQEAPAGGPAAAPPIPGPGGAASPPPTVVAETAMGDTAGATTTIVNGAPLQYSAAWHHKHLYDPRSITYASTMPSFRFLYEKRRITGERSADAVPLTGEHAPPDGWEVVPTYDAKCLVAYLMSLDQSHALKEVKAAGGASAPAPGNAVK